MALATTQDLETSLRRPVEASESLYAESLLNRAETLIKVRIPHLQELCAKNPELAQLASQVEAEAVARVLRADNAGIYTSESEDGYSYRLNLKVASGLLDILPEEWARLLGTGGLRSVAPQSGGYAAERFRDRDPSRDFQFRFPAYDSLAERW